jgi:hypothetical protein
LYREGYLQLEEILFHVPLPPYSTWHDIWAIMRWNSNTNILIVVKLSTK